MLDSGIQPIADPVLEPASRFALARFPETLVAK
jgi:hypothetical protein